MAVARLTDFLTLQQSDSVIMLYGQGVNDAYITPDLLLHDHDGIDKILFYHLRQNGYERIIYYSTDRSLYAYDEQSCRLCLPEQSAPPPPAAARSGSNDRPLGANQYLKRPGPPPQTTPEPADASSAPVGCNWDKDEEFISIMSGDVAIAECLKTCFRDRKHKTAIIFSQFDQNSLKPAVERLVDNLITRWLRDVSDNKCFIILQASDTEELRQTTDRSPTLKNLLNAALNKQTLHTLVCLQAPSEDEIRNILHLSRLRDNKKLDWLHLDKMVRCIAAEQRQLKYWYVRLKALAALDVPSLNQILDKDWQINTRENLAWERLDELIGLTEFKAQVRAQVQYLKRQKASGRQEHPVMHLVLTGNPGTGKTTAARILAEIYREEGLLRRGHFIETDSADLVAGYVGQTAIKTDDLCRRALGGILFIDEAYALGSNKNQEDSNQFGKEAISTLIKRMYDWKDQLLVILAGYPKPMEELLKVNPGFQRRISRIVHIADYTPDELLAIFRLMAGKNHQTVAPELETLLLRVFDAEYRRRDEHFKNAGLPELLLQAVGERHLNRCILNGLDDAAEPLRPEDLPPEYLTGGGGPGPESIDVILEELDAMTGLRKVKEHVHNLVAELQYNRLLGQDMNLQQLIQKTNRHLIFSGNPGTGKTTVARIMGRIFKALQILSDGSLIETSRPDLIAGFSGQTALKTREVLESALDKVLLIDEAYDLKNGPDDLFGQEAINTLLKYMEDHRDRLVVILTGYKRRMELFLTANPGLSSRFPTIIDFENYNKEELFQILLQVIGQSGHQLTSEAIEVARDEMARLSNSKNEVSFGNGREVHNFFTGTVIPRHQRRIIEAIRSGEMEASSPSIRLITPYDLSPRAHQAASPSADNEKKEVKNTDCFEDARHQKEAQAISYTNTGSGDFVVGSKTTVNNYYNSNTNGAPLPHILTPFDEERIRKAVARPKLIQAFHQSLFDGQQTTRLNIRGVQGIGKSTLVRQFILQYGNSFQHVIWVDGQAGIVEGFIADEKLMKFINPKGINNGDNTDVRFDTILKELKSLMGSKACLVVVDNVGQENNKEIEEMAAQLKPNFKIVFISREKFENQLSLEVTPLEPQESRSLFLCDMTETFEPTLLDALFAKVGNHPFALETIAKKIRSKEYRDINEVLDLLDQYDVPKGLPTEGDLFEFFSQVVRVDQLSEAEQALLRYFAIIPSSVYTFEEILTIFNCEDEQVRKDIAPLLNMLISKGFISGDINHLYCHQMIRKVVLRFLRPDPENCIRMLEGFGPALFSRLDGNTTQREVVETAGRYYALLEEFVGYFDEETLSKYLVLKNVSILAVIIGAFDRAIFYLDKDLAVVQPHAHNQPLPYFTSIRLIAAASMLAGGYSKAEGHLSEALALLDTMDDESEAVQAEKLRHNRLLGAMLMQMGVVARAIPYLDAAYELAGQVSLNNPYESALLYNDLADGLILMNSPERALEMLELSDAEYRTIEMPPNTFEYGILHITFSLAQAGRAEFGEANYHIEKAEEIFNNIFSPDHIAMFRLLQVKSVIQLAKYVHDAASGETYSDRGQQHDRLVWARQYAEKAEAVLLKYRPVDHPDFAMLYSNLGIIHKHMGNDQQFLDYQTKALNILKTSSLTESLQQAIINFRIALLSFDGVTSLTDHEIEGYLLNAEKSLPAGEIYQVFRGVSALFRAFLSKRNNKVHEAINLFLKAKSDFEDQLEEDHPAQALCLYEAAMLQNYIGETNAAIENQQQVVSLCERFMDEKDEELAMPYLLLSELYLKSSNIGEALRYRNLANSCNPEFVASLGQELPDCGHLYLRQNKNNNYWEYVVLPVEEQGQSSNISNGYVVAQYDSHKTALFHGTEIRQEYGPFIELSPNARP